MLSDNICTPFHTNLVNYAFHGYVCTRGSLMATDAATGQDSWCLRCPRPRQRRWRRGRCASAKTAVERSESAATGSKKICRAKKEELRRTAVEEHRDDGDGLEVVFASRIPPRPNRAQRTAGNHVKTRILSDLKGSEMVERLL